MTDTSRTVAADKLKDYKYLHKLYSRLKRRKESAWNALLISVEQLKAAPNQTVYYYKNFCWIILIVEAT